MPFSTGLVRPWSVGDTRRLLRAPGTESDKRSRGVVALRTGSEEYPGAAVLGVEGAWRSGCGYVRYIGPRRAADLVLARRPETVTTAPDGPPVRADVWVIGSGTDAATRPESESRALRALLAGPAPVVVDAGALDLLPSDIAPVVTTPHAGEFLRLRAALGLTPPADGALQDTARRAEAARETAEALGATVLLKGATTLVADADAVIAVEAGTPWLATAGTGDVLAGVIGALVAADRAAGAQTPLAELAAAAAWLHGLAARLRSDSYRSGPGRPIVALEVAEALPAAIAHVWGDDDAALDDDDEQGEGRA